MFFAQRGGGKSGDGGIRGSIVSIRWIGGSKSHNIYRD
jgi:hypothetical protein